MHLRRCLCRPRCHRQRGRDSLSGGDRVEGREAVDDCHGKYSTRLRGDLSQNDLRYHPDAQ